MPCSQTKTEAAAAATMIKSSQVVI